MDMMKLMQQAQEMQGRLQQIQDELAQRTVTGTAGGGTVTVEAGGTPSVSSSPGVVVVVVSVGVGDDDLSLPPKIVVPRSPPDAELPATSSGTVMITAAMMKPSSPVVTASCQLRRRPGSDAPGASPSCAMRASIASGVSAGCSGSPGRVALRTTPRTGTARVTTSAGFANASLISATMTGVNAAAASVPGAHSCDVT